MDVTIGPEVFCRQSAVYSLDFGNLVLIMGFQMTLAYSNMGLTKTQKAFVNSLGHEIGNI